MGRIRLLGRDVAAFILTLSSALSFAAGGGVKPVQVAAGAQTSATVLNNAGKILTLLPNGEVLSSGGVESGVALNAVTLEDPQTGAVVPLASSLHHARAFHSATLLPNGTVFIFGGFGGDSSVCTQAESLNTTTQTFIDTSSAGLTPRARHTATLLTDGRLLFAGGVDSVGRSLGRIELWDFRTGQVSTLSGALNTPRSGHKATLLSDGTVLLWGGQDENGVPLNDGEIVDPNGPSIRLVSRQSSEPRTPYVEASIPQSGETGVATDQIISLRFSKPLEMASLNSGTVSLRSLAGSTPITVVPAEGGMLAFVTPQAPLDTNTTYALAISGAKDSAGQLLNDSNIVFTTGDEVTSGTIGTASGSTNDGSVDSISGSVQGNGSVSPSAVRKLPMLKGPDGVTALAGQALTLDGAPLPNVRIEIESQSGLTDNSGRFLVPNVGTGHHVMTVDGTTANTKAASYGIFRVGVDLKAGRTNSLNYTIWMTALDTAHEVSIPSPTTREMIVTNPNVPGLELHIPAGAVIRDMHGNPVTRIGITGIPVSQPPFPLKHGIRYPVYFTIQPGGSTFENKGEKAWPNSVTNRGKGMTIHYQNYLSASPGSRFAFWSYDPEQRGWHVYGHGKVTPDAKEIAPEAGTQLWTFDGAMVSVPGNGPNPAPIPGNPTGGEPVDLQTGLFVYRKTDLVLNDVLPLVLSRAYRPGDSLSRAFGIGTSMSFDDFMIGDDNQTTEGYTYQDLVMEDGGRVHFTRTSPCIDVVNNGSYCGFENAVYEATSTPGPYYGATLQYFSSGPYSSAISTGDYWQLTKKDGTTYIFPDSDDSSNPRDAAVQLMHDRHGNTVRLARDSTSNNLTSVTSPNGRWIQFSYDTQNRVTQARDNAGRIVSYTYNSAGYLETATDANGGVTRYAYDANGNMTSVTDPRNITYIQNTYDDNGMVTQQTMVDGGTYHFSYELDGNGDVTRTTTSDPLGNVRQVTFNSDGYMTNDVRAQGKPEQQSITYNRQQGTGLELSVTDALNRQTAFTYDAAGNVTSVTRLAGTSNAVTTSFGYDPQYFEVSSVSDPLGNTEALSYDSYGNLLALTDPLGNTTNFTYNAAGQPLTMTDPIGNETQYGYDSGNLVSISDPLGRTSTRFFDSAGRIESLTDPLNNQTSIVYDFLNEVTSETDPMGNTTSFAYDRNGNLHSVTDARGNATTYEYDNMDRLLTRTDPLNHSEGFQYDGDGNLKQYTDRKGQTTTYHYDGLNRLTTTTFNDGNSTTNAFDAGNRITSIADSQSGTISRGYDDLDQLTSEGTPLGSVSYSYDADGRRQTMSVSGQTPVNYVFDNASRLSRITQGSSQVSFGYDPDWRRTSMTLPNGITANYSYDGASQLTEILYEGGSFAPANLEYTYDQAGGRTSVSGTLASTQLPVPVMNAVYNTSNQLVQWGSTQMTYDANGSTLNDGMNTYNWDARNQLVSANGGGATFAYDSLGRRASRTILGANSSYVYDGVTPVQELNESNVTANLLTAGMDEYLTRSDANGTLNYLTDALGSTIALVGPNQNSLVQYSYSPYGSISVNGVTTNSYTYTNRETDGLGLYYFRARYYNPNTGRFLSEDPVGFAGGDLNLYAYVWNSPTNFVDPTGLDGWTRFWGGVQAIGGGVEAAAGFGLGAATSWSGVGAVGGVLVGLHGLDQAQAGVRAAFTGCHADSLTSGGLQAAGLSQNTANLIDAGLSVAGGGAAGAGAAGARAGEAGIEFSHWIPNRMGGPRSIFNGNFVSQGFHYLTDPYRYPSGWQSLGPKLNPALQQALRVPWVYDGAAGGAVAGGAQLAGRKSGGCQ